MSATTVGGRWALVAFLIAVISSACAAPTDQAGPDATDTTEETSEEFNDADVRYLERMILHDQQAEALLGSVASRSERAELIDFGRRVQGRYGQELAALRNLLGATGADTPVGDSAGRSAPGVVSEDDRKALQRLRGDRFDRSLIQLLVRDHQSVVTASEQVIDQGAHPGVADLAAKIFAAREAELDQLSAWQRLWWPRLRSVERGGLDRGDRGRDVLALEQRLAGLHYHVGEVDGVFDRDTAFGVVAFQKVAGMPRTGVATADLVRRLATAQFPPPLVPRGGGRRVEVDLRRQVLYLYERDSLFRILPISSGSGERFCVEGDCQRATTPAGAYRRSWHVDGWRKSRLGRLYKPVYVIDRLGIAIHGYPSVPAEPASRGCIRIPMSAAEWFPDRVPRGTPIYIMDGETPVGTPPTEPGAT